MADRLTVRSLRDVSMETLHRASTEAFADYPVDVQMTLAELKSMCRQNSVVFALSAGLFDRDELVGFWVNGVRTIDGRSVAYDSGTAICKQYRGRGLSKRLAELSNALLAEHGVEHYVLEVLTQNETAHGIYLKDGFQVRRKLLCLRTFEPVYRKSPLPPGLSLDAGPFDPAVVPRLPAMEYEPSWQNATESMINIRDEVHTVLVRSDDRIVGYGLALIARGRITQLGVEESLWGGPVPSVVLERLCRASQYAEIAAINVDPDARRTLDLLSRHGFELYVDQFEMEKPLGVVGTCPRSGFRGRADR
jgi:ribosomal protein S18 acetylase RimI-like enzyme